MGQAMPNSWLYQQIRAENSSWEMVFTRRSALNWGKAFSFEISQEHGSSPQDQYQSCIRVFVGSVEARRDPPAMARVFGPLFHSLTFSVSLATLHERQLNFPWVFASAIVTWYYAVYNASRSMLAAL